MLHSRSIQWLSGEAREFVRVPSSYWRYKDGAQTRDLFYVWMPVLPLEREFTLDAKNLSKASKRLPGEALIQGGKISPYGDNAVTNIQWDIAVGYDNWDQLDPSHKFTAFLDYSSRYGIRKLVSGRAPQYCTLGTTPRWVLTSNKFDFVEQVFTNTAYSLRRYCFNYYASDDGTVTIHTRAAYLRRWNYDGTGTAVWLNQYTGVQVYYTDRDKAGYTAASYASDNNWTKVGNWSTSKWNAQRLDADYISTLPLMGFHSGGPRNSKGSLLPHTTIVNNGDSLYGASFDIPDQTIMQWQSSALGLMSAVPSFTDEDKSSLAASCLDQVNYFDGNMIAFLGDMSKVGDSIKSILHLIPNARSVGEWASSWLSLRFGDRLQIADTASLIEGIRKWARDVRYDHNAYRAQTHSSGTVIKDGVPITYNQYLTAEIDLSSGMMGDMENLLAAPYRWDLVPSLANAWDLIPFSFVVDWVYDVQSILEQIDRMNEYGLLDIKAQMSGYKRVCELDLHLIDSNYDGSIKYTHYSRTAAQVSSWLRLNPWTDYAPLSVRPVNVLDGASLLIQYRN